ncbi:MAG: hypothetical protein QG652_15 [Pseudomonadota bacterium]|nr:hypothetical protein [Pseudomonadota bacterium]
MRRVIIVLCCVSLLSCSQSAPDHRAIHVLIDRSGAYGGQFDQVAATIKWLLLQMESGDSLALARIDNENFSALDVVAGVTFSSRPSQANAEKRAVLKILEQLAEDSGTGSYTDITGGLLHAMSWLNATGARKKMIIVFSDFPDEPREGYLREFPVYFNGARVVVWNPAPAEPATGVALTGSRSFSERAQFWQQRVVAGGGDWQLASDTAEIKSWFH